MKWLEKLKRAAGSKAPPVSYESGSPFSPAAEKASISANDQAVRKLSPREHEVFLHLLNGVKVKDIAVALNIQTSTVSGYCREIYRALGVNSKAQLILKFGNYRNIN